MHQEKGVFFLFFIFVVILVKAQSDSISKRTYTTSRLKSEIVIDGKLEDAAWDQVDWGGDFVGQRPDYNTEPSQETQFKVLYDAKFVYVAIRAFDLEPGKIVKRMSRRDGFEGDRVAIMFDSYFDKRTAFSFSASVSGVKGEEYISNNGDDWDATWDPIWYLRTTIDEKGWIAEFKIPLSQLRFANREVHTWGLQVARFVFRKDEWSTWQPADPNAQGWVHLFGEMKGIQGIKPQKQLEIQPYVLASYQKFPKEEENPFRDTGKKFDANLGLDAKIGITSDITLDLTINPDFGQVDADPSQVNLSAFQLFFRERRPFFLEGANLLSFRTSGGSNNLFYSRRIGGSPNGQPENVEYIDRPNNTSILGAAKITGKNAKGFSWGLLESLANRETADVVYEDGTRGNEIVEPYTNYLVARAQQDIDGGKTVVGAIATNVRRFNNRENELELLHDDATSAGVDIDHNFRDRKYGFQFRAMFSRVRGTAGAIYKTQTASQRFFQRSNNSYKSVDSTRTSLLGSAATLSLGKRSGNWRWSIGSNYRSPELALNDAGFLRQTDDMNNWLWTQYRVNKVTKTFRTQRYNIYAEYNNDFGGVITNRGINLNLNLEFKNYWEFGQGVWIGGDRVSNADLRGGPSIKYPGNINYWYWIGSNSRKKVRVSFDNWFNWGNNDFRESTGMSLGIDIRATDALQISISPGLNISRDNLQYIQTDEFNGEDEYLLGKVNQRSYSLSARMNYNITPNLTIEFWGQPFLASIQYSDFKKVHLPNSENFKNRYQELPYTYELSDDEYHLQDYDPEGTFILSNPSFANVILQSNMVLRWEYIPGSTLFLVWSTSGFADTNPMRGSFRELASNLSSVEGTNTFLVKYTYRFVL